ncbi:hypothetical protein UFOVP696_21 [uncultured Caudovirales phage]|uniref:Uncharacterized protein n=1 Tax=uncultured Caudovirales phage TaxID=2100421 RepID=A0A6J5NLY7_9CAUD|nr:hypothetical protein UFOVP429_146 [uncultured Caudovirales phage]CAB4158135.1 hypothetical protein UFOVP696_21 [uncultured Caudovirales phage]
MSMVWIGGATSAGSTSTFTFASIPSTFSHLQLRLTGRSVSNQSTPYDAVITVNGANPTTFIAHRLSADGGSVTSASVTSDNVFRSPLCIPNAFHTANVFGSVIFDFLDYANTSKNKTVRIISGYDNNGGSSPAAGWVNLVSSAWFDTSAVSNIQLFTFGNWAAGSRADLYGITSSSVTGA